MSEDQYNREDIYIDVDALEEALKRLQEMDNLPADLERLDQAIDTIRAITKVKITKITKNLRKGSENDVIRIDEGMSHHNISIKGSVYIDHYMHGPDMGATPHESTEKLAWSMAAGLEFLPPNIAAVRQLREFLKPHLSAIQIQILYEIRQTPLPKVTGKVISRKALQKQEELNRI